MPFGKQPRLWLLAPICLFACAAKPAPSSDDRWRITLHPVVGAAGDVIAMQVEEDIFRSAPGTITLSTDNDTFGYPPLGKVVRDLTFSDGQGISPAASETDPAAADKHIWRSNRSLAADVVVRFRVPVADVKFGGPPLALKASGHGVAGNSAAFLLLPAHFDALRVTIVWDLAELPSGSIGVSTTGRGTVTLTGDALADGQWFMAGPAKMMDVAEQPGLNAYLLGQPPFDGSAFMQWAKHSYEALRQAFATDAPRYNLFIRTLAGTSFATGTATDHAPSALLTVGTQFPADQDLGGLKMMTLHEMTHHWVGLTTPESPWFVEGLTEYESIRIGCDVGLATPDQCADEINSAAHNYYISRGRNFSQAEIDRIGFHDEYVRRVPYGRSLLYFALLDADIRGRSSGKRTLLDAMRPLFKARQQGVPLTQPRFEGMLIHELGPEAVPAFHRIVIDGKDEPVPPKDAFGPKLTRIEQSWDTDHGTVHGYAWHVREDGSGTGASS